MQSKSKAHVVQEMYNRNGQFKLNNIRNAYTHHIPVAFSNEVKMDDSW